MHGEKPPRANVPATPDWQGGPRAANADPHHVAQTTIEVSGFSNGTIVEGQASETKGAAAVRRRLRGRATNLSVAGHARSEQRVRTRARVERWCRCTERGVVRCKLRSGSRAFPADELDGAAKQTGGRAGGMAAEWRAGGEGRPTRSHEEVGGDARWHQGGEGVVGVGVGVGAAAEGRRRAGSVVARAGSAESGAKQARHRQRGVRAQRGGLARKRRREGTGCGRERLVGSGGSVRRRRAEGGGLGVFLRRSQWQQRWRKTPNANHCVQARPAGRRTQAVRPRGLRRQHHRCAQPRRARPLRRRAPLAATTKYRRQRRSCPPPPLCSVPRQADSACRLVPARTLPCIASPSKADCAAGCRPATSLMPAGLQTGMIGHRHLPALAK